MLGGGNKNTQAKNIAAIKALVVTIED